MGKSTAERQRAYRQRAKIEGEGARRLHTWISSAADLALTRLARHGGVSRRAMLERLIIEADERQTEGVDIDSPEWAQYFEGALK